MAQNTDCCSVYQKIDLFQFRILIVTVNSNFCRMTTYFDASQSPARAYFREVALLFERSSSRHL